MIVNLIFADAIENDAAHQAYRDAMQSVANMLDAHITDNITVNINVDLDNFEGAPLPANVSEGNIQTFPTISYSNLRSDLANDQTLSADDTTALNALPTGSSIGGQSSFTIGTAQEKALGLISATDPAVDGTIGMNSSFGTGDVLFAGALHEITHAMGRIAGTTLDIYRFNENGTNNHVFGGAKPALPAYFSIDGGTTKLADFGITSDPGDFLNGGVQGTDPLNETVGGRGMTAVDMTMMDVLGFDVANAAPTVAALTGTVGEDGPSFNMDLLTGAADPEGDSISIQNLVGSVTTTDGRSLTLGTDYTISGSTIALTSQGFAKFNSLSAGSTDKVVFGYDVQDFLGADTHNTLTVTINGLNDAPALAADTGSPHPLTELSGTTSSASLDGVSGTLSFTDVDIGDTHGASASLLSLVWSGGITPSASQTALASAMSDSIKVDGTTGSLGWQFSLADKNVDFLAANETLTATYDVTVTDNNSASSTEQVAVIFTGTNDTPMVDAASSVLANATSELPNVTNSSAVDSTSGVVAFSDPDLNDRPTAAINTAGETVTWQDATHNYTSELTPAQIALLEASVSISAEAGNTNTGNIDWHYDIVDKNLDFLGGGESLTVTAPIVINDHNGGVISQNIVVTINGANDDPIAAADSNGTSKKSTVSVSAVNGLLANDTDPDAHDQGHLFVGAVDGLATNVGHTVAGTYGSVNINADGSYVYEANKGGLPSKIVAQDTFNYTVADGHGGTDISTLSVIVSNPGVNYLAGANTTLHGGNGSNVLDGAAGHDVLIGGNGADVLVGGIGDTLTGGNGPDTFLFRPDFGINTVTDFDFHNDAIQLDKSIFSSVADLLSHTTDTAGGAVITDTHGDSIALMHVTLAQLQTHQNDLYLV
jgi:VCBS repeat-containing protein